MFKTTTVAVDGEKAEDGEGMTPENTALTDGAREGSPADKTGQSSPKPGPTISFSLGKNSSSTRKSTENKFKARWDIFLICHNFYCISFGACSSESAIRMTVQ